MEAQPGTTHHGQPMQIIDCGETEIDPETFQEYLVSLREMYTPSAYHLMDFNCNHFTADVVGFLSGAVIPSWISGKWEPGILLKCALKFVSGLPAEFLSTPFGQQMRPQIDAMFRRTAPSEHPVGGANLPTSPASGGAPPLASDLLASVSAQATANPAAPPPQASPLVLVSSSTNFDAILKQHPAVVVNFTNTPGCPPCRAIKPVYESIAADSAANYGAKGARFVEIELGVGQGQELASRHGVSATPTFMFFRQGKKVDELRGAGKRELEGKVESFMEECFPRHPHRKLYLPAVEAIPISPITSTTTPPYPALLTKLESFGADKEKVRFLREKVVPVLEGKGIAGRDLLVEWGRVSNELLESLKPAETYPLIDLWRVGLLNPEIASTLAVVCSPTSSSGDPISSILALAVQALNASATSTPKSFLLTVLRLLTNLLAPIQLANLLLTSPPAPMQGKIVSIVVDSLLHRETAVRSAAAGVAVNLGGWRHRVAKEQGKEVEDGLEVEWEVDVVSALLEAVERESDEDVGERRYGSVSWD